ncbi:hypothetical protein HK097_004480 [Rhizophlyctis rosea]|uniref:RPEL repeat protein n=1 Tax=Rhizophlyctis rosea TaxID=64517 RepID=A0AAD5X6F9_9FUNG|nr:hypothetical protein HK097_004480 [Rhizophlyctis rosea]
MTTTLPPITTSNLTAGGVPAGAGVGADQVDDGKGLGKVMSDLSKKLGRRSTPEDLVQRNILREDEVSQSSHSTSSSLIAAKKSLEEAKTKDSLDRRIANRPSKVDLKLRNILRVDSSEAIDQAGVGLDQAVNIQERGQALRSCLKKRPERRELEEMNIIKPATHLDASLVAAQERLKRSQLEDLLNSRLEHRPQVEELEQARILVFAETVEVLPTFRKSEYNRKPDGNATFKKLTPQLKVAIREELNTFKKTEMSVHEQSLRNTCFH